jgi:hypothetical protein
MARIDTTQLTRNATAFADRIDQVQKDPAVRKAWTEAGGDIATAFTSVKAAADETRAAWRRTDLRSGTDLAVRPA